MDIEPGTGDSDVITRAVLVLQEAGWVCTDADRDGVYMAGPGEGHVSNRPMIRIEFADNPEVTIDPESGLPL